MGNIRKIGDEYYIEFMARGLKYQQKAGLDRKGAQKLLDEIEQKIATGEMGTVVRDVDVEIFVEDFLRSLKKEHSLKTRKRFQQAVSRFYDFVKKKPLQIVKLSQLTPSVFEQYKNFLLKKEHVAPKGVNLSLVLLSEFCEYARRTGYLNDNPLLHIKFVSVTYPLPCYLSRPELNSLLAIIPAEFKEGHLSDLEVLREFLLKIKADAQLRDDFERKIINAFPKKKLGTIDIEHTFAFYALQRNISLVNLTVLMGKDDVAKVMIYFPFVSSGGDDVLSSSLHSVH